MRTVFLTGCVVLVAGFSARAETLPTFHATCSYRATHIVVASTEPGAVGRFKLGESWKGDLKPGETLTIPGLANDAKGDMVLFLRRDIDPTTAATSWKPVGIGTEWRVSVVWFDGEKVLAVQQHSNPGPAVISEDRFVKSRKEFKQLIDYYLDTERAFAAARAIRTPGDRAAAFAKIVNGPFDRREEAFEELGRCGPAALPALRAYLNGPPDYQQGYAVRAMVAAGGKDVVPELHAMLGVELSYWKKIGPKLTKFWWLDDQSANEPWKRFGKLRCLVDVYEIYQTPEYRAAVVAVRDYLRTIPVINEDAGIGNLSDLCDRVLTKGDR